MTNLSVNINKIATLRNARGGNMPNVVQAAIDCQRFGADGITIHPRPDQRHITKQDVYDIKEVINTEFNIEGYPSKEFIKMVLDVKPEQVTLVPDAVDVITSNNGWNTVENHNFLKEVISEFKKIIYELQFLLILMDKWLKEQRHVDRIGLSCILNHMQTCLKRTKIKQLNRT